MGTAFQEGLSWGKSAQPVGRAIEGEEWSKEYRAWRQDETGRAGRARARRTRWPRFSLHSRCNGDFSSTRT